MTTTARHDESIPATAVIPTTSLLMSMELGRYEWKVGFTTGLGQRPRRRSIRTDHWERLIDEIAAAKRRFGLPADAPVISCYEAGPDGFWIHRYLATLRVSNLVVDSSSIEVSRRARRPKTDRVDVERLLALLLRYVNGERTALRVVRVPTEGDEQRRQLHRELRSLITDRRRVINRITGLLATQGIRMNVRRDFRERLCELRQWDGQPLAAAFRMRLEREWDKIESRRSPDQSGAGHAVRRSRCCDGPPAARAARPRRSQRLVVCHGNVRVAPVYESATSWSDHRVDTDAVPERHARSRTGHQQGRQSNGAHDRRTDRVDLGPLSAQ
jgi:hypothetical protein